ncbi:MAG: hypothetical protein KME31_31975 [Tolypothrix carrinoi HA7290-LM1]|nr:hypothetical protein [Tolypothrix carrinoi HA7290-LM1]
MIAPEYFPTVAEKSVMGLRITQERDRTKQDRRSHFLQIILNRHRQTLSDKPLA